ncbi:unnamed protein product [Sphagnum compactum]
MISSSSFSSCNLLRGIPQRPQKMMMIPGWWRVNLVSQHVVPKGCKVSPLQSSSHSCWAAKKAGYQHGKEEEDEEAPAAEETLAGQMQEKSHHLPLLDKFQQQLQDNNDGSDNSTGGCYSGSLEGSPAAATGSVFGAVTLITGTSVGAGILALPATTAPAGFVPSAVVMGLSWGFLLLEALLLAEVNVALMMRQRQTGEKLHSEVLSLRTMAEQTLGPLGGAFTTVTYLMLSYTLLVAYIAKSGEMLSLMFNVPISFGAAVFTFAFGGIICFGGNDTVDDINQALTTLLVGFFLLIVAGGMSAADWSGLEHMDWAMAPQTIPIMILALVYHDLTPVLCAHLGGDKDRIRKSIVLGSMVPLVMFLLWDAVALCLVPVSGSQDSVDVLISFGGTGLAFVIEAFSLLAVATSFIGTVLGLSEFLVEQLGKAQTSMSRRGRSIRRHQVVYLGSQPISKWLKRNGIRACATLLMLVPPLVASYIVSDAFYSASNFAGAYGMTSLYGVIPPAMAWTLHRSGSLLSERSKEVLEPKPSQQPIVVPGGKLTLAGIGACACVVILGQIVLDLPELSTGTDPNLVLTTVGHEENLLNANTYVNHNL